MKRLLTFACLALALSACEKTKQLTDALDPDSLHNRPVGSSANELLSGSQYTSLKIEVQYMPGFAPDAAALNQLQTFLTAYLNKPAGITITTKEIAASGSTSLNADQVHAVEKANRSAFSINNQLAVYVLYTNGNFSDDKVLGIAYRNTSIALFGKKIRDNSGGLGQVSRTKLEATVLEHEIGHLLGLVDVGSAMQTPHKANGNHCSNQACLMFYSAETTDVLGVLRSGNVPALDDACVADLRANGGK